MAPDNHKDKRKKVKSKASEPAGGETPARETPEINLEDPTERLERGRPRRRTEHAAVLPSEVKNDFQRYNKFQTLGEGGVATVKSCFDPHLGRLVAIKLLQPSLQNNREQRTRFVREARVMAQIEHPNIVPVHEFGVGKDGNVYFTMKRVKGVTLRHILFWLKGNDPETVEKYPLSQLLNVFTHVCQAIAFAHSRGVIHRDLKPDNIMIGAFGEVLVTDWGLAKIIGAQDEIGQTATMTVNEIMDLESGDETVEGIVTGTPHYMAPEQALGKTSELDGRTDLYGLGVLLYEILTLERPHGGDTVNQILREVINGRIMPPRRRRPGRKIPPELDAICMKALAREQEDRYPGVPKLIGELESYRSGHSVEVYREPFLRKELKWCRRHPVFSSTFSAVLAVLVFGLGLLLLVRTVRYQALMAAADTHRKRGSVIVNQERQLLVELQNLRRTRIVKSKSPRELVLERGLAKLHRKSETRYDSALMLYMMATDENVSNPRCGEAFAEIFGNRLDYALAQRDYKETERLLDSTRNFFGANFAKAEPAVRQNLLELATLLKGDGSLEVRSRPAGATVTLWRLTPGGNGVLTPAAPRKLDTKTPVSSLALPRGSYLLTLKLAGRPEVRYPVRIDHSEAEEANVFLPREIPAGMVYVPAGKFYSGGEHANYYRLHEKALGGFFVKSKEIIFGEYLEFWLDPAGGGRRREYLSLVRLSHASRHLEAAWDQSGKLLEPLRPELPVVGITQAAAARYCAWLSRKIGRACRLPTAEEWEKAARGVDGRSFVWGNHYQPEFAFARENKAAHARFKFWAPPGSFPADRSIYGAWDMGGNVREWTASRLPDGSPFYQVKGASASLTRRFLYCAYASDTPVVPSDVGFRYVMPLEDEPERK